jgi:hypothetical protein
MAEPDCPAQINDGFPQPVLHMLQVVGRDPQPVDKLCSCIIGHTALRSSSYLTR